jgi:phage baseplate assembly protein W
VSEQFIGRGFAFPMHTDPTGRIALVGGDREIAESIRLILGTAPGERPMRPQFGCAIADLVFAPIDATTAGRISYEVRRALTRWEPRIELDGVLVDLSGAATGTVHIDVRYRLRSTNEPRNLVFPFYVIPTHESDY